MLASALQDFVYINSIPVYFNLMFKPCWNAQLENEFAKIEEIREDLRIAEATNRKIKVMLGIEKTPDVVEPSITEISPNYTEIEVLKEMPENIPSMLPTMGQLSREFGPGHYGIDIAAPQFT